MIKHPYLKVSKSLNHVSKKKNTSHKFVFDEVRYNGVVISSKFRMILPKNKLLQNKSTKSSQTKKKHLLRLAIFFISTWFITSFLKNLLIPSLLLNNDKSFILQKSFNLIINNNFLDLKPQLLDLEFVDFFTQTSLFFNFFL